MNESLTRGTQTDLKLTEGGRKKRRPSRIHCGGNGAVIPAADEMARSGDPDERDAWGTWEELLLACAVSRHGTRRWDSVSMEIQSRTAASHLVTPQGCRQRFRDLQRRFGAGGDNDGSDADPDPPADVPWLEELRRLRVAELRGELERCDLSIGSLQSKVKRLQEDRDRSVRDGESGEGKPDGDAKEEGGSPKSTPGSLAGDPIQSGGASGPSCEQSNSTDPKQKSGEGLWEAEKEAADPSTEGNEKMDEGSYNGSTGSPAAEAAARSHAMGESGESIAESKGGGGGGGGEGEESSDVQSSASLSRSRRRKVVPDGGGEEPEAGDASILNERAAAESQPLVSLLRIIRSDEYGPVFERRLGSQDCVRYRSLIRHHVDLEMVRAKLDRLESGCSYATAEFFRDMLLLCTNAVVFYAKGSPEAVAAVNLRRLLAKEMTSAFRRPKEPTVPPPPPPAPQPEPTDSKPKLEPDLPVALLEKPLSPTPLIVCRKRSSISNKPAVAVVNEERDEKADPGRKELDNEVKNPQGRTTNEKSGPTGTTRGLRTTKVRGGNGGGGPAAKKPNLAPAPTLKSKSLENVPTVEEAVKPDKKNCDGGGAGTGTAPAPASSAKKQSATSFLNRMKRSSNGTLMEMLKTSSSSAGGIANGMEQKDAKGDDRKDQRSRRGAGGRGGPRKRAAETGGGSAKRSVGRPPKRAAAPPPPPPPAKRAREAAEAPTRTSASAPRKRGRR
ncbi:BROMO [Musa troglodytarum]|uniref:BROMO n=1 Tax=Musa troglodytarum TaxID=320322 RepID=A0A9E7KWA4_9LILI|nr:BROMO [Musa troglodytarum]